MKRCAALSYATTIVPITLIVSIAIALVSSARCTQSGSYKPAAWQSGQWVEYTVSARGHAAGKGSVRLRYSITGEGTEDAVRYFWFETSGTLDTSTFVFKVMVPERQLNQARRVIIKIGAETAKEMPPELSEAPVEYQPPFFDPLEIARAKPRGVQLKTPAGVFRCLHARIGEGEVWLSSEVPVTGIVRYRSADQDYELTALGRTGAATGITELPERIDLDKIFPADSAGK